MWKVQPLPFSHSLPTRLDPHSSATYYVEAEALQERHSGHGTAYAAMRPFVEIAGGRRIYAKGGVPLS